MQFPFCKSLLLSHFVQVSLFKHSMQKFILHLIHYYLYLSVQYPYGGHELTHLFSNKYL